MKSWPWSEESYNGWTEKRRQQKAEAMSAKEDAEALKSHLAKLQSRLSEAEDQATRASRLATKNRSPTKRAAMESIDRPAELDATALARTGADHDAHAESLSAEALRLREGGRFEMAIAKRAEVCRYWRGVGASQTTRSSSTARAGGDVADEPRDDADADGAARTEARYLAAAHDYYAETVEAPNALALRASRRGDHEEACAQRKTFLAAVLFGVDPPKGELLTCIRLSESPGVRSEVSLRSIERTPGRSSLAFDARSPRAGPSSTASFDRVSTSASRPPGCSLARAPLRRDGRGPETQDRRMDLVRSRSVRDRAAQVVQNGLIRSRGSLRLSLEALRCPHTQRFHLELSVRVGDPLGVIISPRGLS